MDGNEVTVVALDRPGLLWRAAGVLASHRLAVRGANASSVGDTAVAVFSVVPEYGDPPDAAQVRGDQLAGEQVGAAQAGSAQVRPAEVRQRFGDMVGIADHVDRAAQLVVAVAMFECEVTIHRDIETVAGVGMELSERYGGAAPTPDMREVFERQAAKRVALEFAERHRATWDHRKLGSGVY